MVFLAPILAVCLPAEVSIAAVKASDSASDAAYADNWQGLEGAVPVETGSDNGGSGFLPWDFSSSIWDPAKSPYPQAHFIDRVPSSFNSLGAPAFALTNGNVEFEGYSAAAMRPFAVPLRPGDRLSCDVDNPKMQPLNPNDSTGFVIRLQTATDLDDDGNLDERFAFYTYQGFNKDEWVITDSRGGETDSDFSDEEGAAGFQFAFTLTGSETYELRIVPRGGGPALTFTGQLANAGMGEIDRIQFLMYGNGSGNGGSVPTGEREFYFNNLLIESTSSSIQKPGDCNQDGSLDISDPICLLGFFFLGMPTKLPCESGASTDPANIQLFDANGDQRIDLSDSVRVFGYLFQGASPPVLGSACQPLAGCPDNSLDCRD